MPERGWFVICHCSFRLVMRFKEIAEMETEYDPVPSCKYRFSLFGIWMETVREESQERGWYVMSLFTQSGHDI